MASPTSHGFWKHKENQLNFFLQIAKELRIKNHEDWGKITQKQIIARGGATIINKYHGGSLYRTLQSIFPGIL